MSEEKADLLEQNTEYEEQTKSQYLKIITLESELKNQQVYIGNLSIDKC